MPLYEYKCSECGFEVKLPLPIKKRNNQTACPGCGNDMDRIDNTKA